MLAEDVAGTEELPPPYAGIEAAGELSAADTAVDDGALYAGGDGASCGADEGVLPPYAGAGGAGLSPYAGALSRAPMGPA